MAAALTQQEKQETSDPKALHDLYLRLIPLGSSDEMRESFAAEFFERVRQENKGDNARESVRVAEELIGIVPYLWDPLEFLRIIAQDDICQLSELSMTHTNEFLLARQQSHFPRKPLTYICEALALLEQPGQAQQAMNTLRGHLPSFSYGLGHLALAKLYLRAKSAMVFGAVKEGMAYAKRLSDSHPSCRFSV